MSIITVGGVTRVMTSAELAQLEQDRAAAATHALEQAKMRIRMERDNKLKDCDWIVTKSLEDGVAIPAVWKNYRQALRDLPSTITDWSVEPTWPAKPQ